VTGTVDPNLQTLDQATSGPPTLVNDSLRAPGPYNWDQNDHCSFAQSSYQAVSEGKANIYRPCFEGADTFRDFTYQVDMTITRGDGGGIIFRDDGQQHNYLFFIYKDGTYLLEVNNNQKKIDSTASSAIKPGLNHTNTITVVARGNYVSFYINGL
jgi:hypothetical protein